MMHIQTHSIQRGFFALGMALALAVGFGVGGWGLVELAEGDTQAAVAGPVERPATIAAQADGEARAD
jgi:hypothetical protein